jgi:hypothetical protein
MAGVLAVIAGAGVSRGATPAAFALEAAPPSVSRGAAPAAVAAANRSLAISRADGLLFGLSLPSDAMRTAKEPAGDGRALAYSIGQLFYAAEVDRIRFWLTAAKPSGVMSSIAAHLPAGAASLGSGWSNGPDVDAFASWSLPTVDRARLGQRLITVQAVKLAGGRTGVRADVWIQYRAPRPLAQRVPTVARVLDITVTQPFSTKVFQSLRVTNARNVRRIAALVDGLPFIGGPRIAISCPAFLPASERLVTFRFRTSPAGPSVATVSLDAATRDSADPCADAALAIRGRQLPPLANGGGLLRRAGAILGVKLAAPAVSRWGGLWRP